MFDPCSEQWIEPCYEYEYDVHGNMVLQRDPKGRETKFTYDHLHNQTLRTLPGGATEIKEYDEFGRLYFAKDFKGQVTGFEYDPRGLLEYKKYYLDEGHYDVNDPCEVVQYIYDNLGRKSQVIDSYGTTTYEYDSEGKLLSVDSPQGVINYEYNPITNQKTRTYSSNTDANYLYDKIGRLLQVQTASETATYYYDAVGNRDYMDLELDGSAGYEIRTDYTYDNLNRLTELVQQKTGGIGLATYNYTLKANGHRHSLSETLSESRDITYEYDNLNRLVIETADSGGEGYESKYTYDLAGNRTKRIVNVNGQTLTTIYQYDPNTDQLTKEIHSGPVYGLLYGNERYYAYAKPSGKGFYYSDSHGEKIGTAQAFFMGLPSVWSRYLLVIAMVLLPVMLFGPATKRVISRLLFCHSKPTRLRLRVPKKGICLLVAFMMLFGPENFDSMSQADVQYTNLSTATWAEGDTTIEYTYDDNGSVETKTTKVTSTASIEETIVYGYNLANRLVSVTTTKGNVVELAEYTYSDDGVRVLSQFTRTIDSVIDQMSTTTYLVDAYNHTGYAQTLEKQTVTTNYIGGVPQTPVTQTTTYLIGDDIIAQTTDGVTEYLLYDGHGSTRQLARYDDSVSISENYSYDSYGVLLQDDTVASSHPGKVDTQATSLLYAGEQWDNSAQMYYLRARYYNPLNGRFNKFDPYAGNTQDPQSLHKYLYVHNNPINAIDPSGLSLLSITIQMAVISSLMATLLPHVFRGYSAAKQILELTGLVNLVRRLANRGIIEFEVAESIRVEAFRTFTDLLGAIGNSMLLIAKEVALYFGYSMAFAAVTHVAMGGAKAGVKLFKSAGIVIDVADEPIKHHLVFKCAVKKGIRQRLWELPRRLHVGKPSGLHSIIWQNERFNKLLPRRGKPMKDVIRNMGKQKWLDELGECYKWLEAAHHGDYNGIYEAYLKAVKDIGGAQGII